MNEVPLEKIIVGERVRKDPGDLDSLAASIKDVGLIQAIAIRPDYTLIAGARRLEACRRLGVSKIPVRIISTLGDAMAFLKAERDENTQRKDFAPSEAVAMGEKLEALEPPLKEKQSKGGKKAGRGRASGESKLRPPKHTKKTSSKVGAAVGMSAKNYEKAKAVKAATKADPAIFGHLLEVMDTKNVDKAYKELKEIQRRQERQEAARKEAGRGRFVTDLSSLKAKQFQCIYVDPPWQYDNRATRASANGNYSGTMAVDDLCRMPVRELAAENAHLHLWTTNAFLFECPKIFAAWGFEFKSCLVWVKPKIGIGNYWRCAHEFLLLGVRGQLTAGARDMRSWVEIPRDEHSAKPEEIRGMIERLSPGPYLEVFGRNVVNGWTVFGNEVIK